MLVKGVTTYFVSQGTRGEAKAFPVRVPALSNNIARNKPKPRIVGGSDGIIRWQVRFWRPICIINKIFGLGD